MKKGPVPPSCSTAELENKHGTCKFAFCASINASINHQQMISGHKQSSNNLICTFSIVTAYYLSMLILKLHR
jgi:hypothetical protein